MVKRFLTSFLAVSLLAGGFSSFALAEDSEHLVEGASCNDGNGYVFDVVGAGLACIEIGTAVPDTDCILSSDGGCEDIGATEEETSVEISFGTDTEATSTSTTEDVVFYEEEDVTDGSVVTEEDGELVVEEVEESEYVEEWVDDFVATTLDSSSPDVFYMSVRWGYFLEEGMDRPDLEVTDWDGVVEFRGLLALPIKMLRFEPGQDSIDFKKTTAKATFFNSDIYNGTDGLLFKVKTDLDIVSEITFDTNGLGGSVNTADLLETGVAVLDYGEYQAVFKVWTPEEWVEEDVEIEDLEVGVAEDREIGAWYERFLNFSIEQGFFGGDRHPDGRPVGTIRPGDEITRFELLKVLFELASRLDIGVGAANCDPKEVDITTSDWMGDHWARGYVQCIEDSGLDVHVLDEIIAGDLNTGSEPSLRIEVVMTGLELLGIAPETSDLSLFTDSNELSEEEKAAVNYVERLGIFEGYPDDSFRPFIPINRAEMFKIVSLFYETFSF